MDAAADSAATPISTLRRRNSIEIPTLQTPPSSADFELISLKPASYTSLRDILPTAAGAVMSPKAPSFTSHSGYEIPIRNRLVKQAAWAYLQPMSTSPDSGGPTVFHRLWTRFSDAFFRFVSRVYGCLLRSVYATSHRL
ncbi:uncharacterized protein [Rutidosis leptorrhynchoides]|uniref:uncharacterized protein n=1 Tax=Rutidosis leptorrhynchoides TaxID=125765 RepID=UPI003A9A0987